MHRCLATLLVCGLLLPNYLWADSYDLKSMILMPGPLSAPHAEEEKECDSCHSKFDQSAQDSLCLDCHKPVNKDILRKKGFHGRSPVASKASCKSCHRDHKGREFDMVPLNKDSFDHNYTDFLLRGKHEAVSCAACHTEEDFRSASSECSDCHSQESPHGEAFANKCANCHQAESWHKLTSFDHSTTEFPLQGHHQKLGCNSCHAGEQYSFESNTCLDCHKPNDVHLGNYGAECSRCHTETAWPEISFRHDIETEFSLTGAHQQTTCKACHYNGLADNQPDRECSSCHLASDIHAGRHGKQCDSCHSTLQWTDSKFDHGKESSWPLTGKHAKTTCLQCHRGTLSDKLDTGCISCHSDKDAHQSSRLKDCADCHQTSGWNETDFFDHELTAFPLEGLHAIVPCQSCHESSLFSQAKSDCQECHQHEDPHKSALGKTCSSCHNPNAWRLWSFDHNETTNFELAGSHENLSCTSCHLGKDADDVPHSCAGCHAAEDRHDGNFGNNCGQCHTDHSFGDIQWQN